MTGLAFAAGVLCGAAAIGALVGWLSRQIDHAVELPRPAAKPRETAPVVHLDLHRGRSTRSWTA